MGLRSKRSQHGFRRQKSWFSFLTAPFRALLGAMEGRDAGLGNQLTPGQRVQRLVVAVLVSPFFWVYQFLVFIVLSWTTTRRMGPFFLGLLPLLGIASVIGIYIGMPFYEPRFAVSGHRRAVTSAEKNEQFDEALIASRRIQRISDEQKWRFLHALTLRNCGLDKQADIVLARLAAFDKTGFPEAHSLLADDLIQEWRSLDQEERESDEAKAKLNQALRHIDTFLEYDPENAQLISIRGQTLQALGREDEAMRIFRGLSAVDPSVVPALVRYLVDEGGDGEESENGEEAVAREARFQEARFHRDRGLRRLREIAAIDPNNRAIWQVMYEIMTASVAYDLASASANEKPYQEILQEFNEVLRSTESQAVAQQVWLLQSNVCLAFADELKKSTTSFDLIRRMVFVSDAVNYYPRNPPALKQFVELALLTEDTVFEDWLDDRARLLLNISHFHLIQGLRATLQGKPGDAQKHFQLAFDGETRAAIMVNDIAYVLGVLEGHPDDAIKILNTAVDQWPNVRLIATRGLVNAADEKYDMAIVDLEYAITELKDDAEVYLALAKCYENTGQPEKAAEARTEADEAKKRLQERIFKASNPALIDDGLVDGE